MLSNVPVLCFPFSMYSTKFFKKTDMMNTMSGQEGGEVGHICLPSFRPHIRFNRPCIEHQPDGRDRCHTELNLVV